MQLRTWIEKYYTRGLVGYNEKALRDASARLILLQNSEWVVGLLYHYQRAEHEYMNSLTVKSRYQSLTILTYSLRVNTLHSYCKQSLRADSLLLQNLGQITPEIIHA